MLAWLRWSFCPFLLCKRFQLSEIWWLPVLYSLLQLPATDFLLHLSLDCDFSTPKYFTLFSAKINPPFCSGVWARCLVKLSNLRSDGPDPSMFSSSIFRSSSFFTMHTDRVVSFHWPKNIHRASLSGPECFSSSSPDKSCEQRVPTLRHPTSEVMTGWVVLLVHVQCW